MDQDPDDAPTRRSVVAGAPDAPPDEPTHEHVRAPALPTPPRLADAMPPRIGRYTIESQLGKGGMGVVYRARDVELDRSVAIKLLHGVRAPGDARVRARFHREAQAMAQLSHPNVVQIHDVGEHDGQVFVAMELIRGQTLRAWLKADTRRPWRDVLALFVPIAEGLAAAHAAGIVHRDIKPENVLVGDDGRPRVGDFGLARRDVDEDGNPGVDASGERSDGLAHEPHGASSLITVPGTLMGTPAYMSPEQHRGAPTDARSDQFSLCVMLWEALYGQRPFAGKTVKELAFQVLTGEPRPPPPGRAVPKWLHRAVLRGLAREANDRHPTTQALVAELRRGPRRTRDRAILAGVVGVALAVGGSLATLHLLAARRDDACVAAGAGVREVWGPDRRAAVEAAFTATGAAYAPTTFERLTPWLDRQADAWSAARTDVCRAPGDPDAADRALWCLEERRIELQTLVDEFTRTDAKRLVKAISSAIALADVATCRDERLLARLPLPPPEQRDAARQVRARLAQAEELRIAGDHERGLIAAQEARAQAEAFNWPPLFAAAALEVGRQLERAGRYKEAEAALDAAYVAATGSGATDIAAESASALIALMGVHLDRHDEALRWSRLAEVALTTLGLEHGLLSAFRLDNLGKVYQRTGKYDDSSAAHARAIEIVTAELGPDHPNIVAPLANLAVTRISQGKPAEAKTMLVRAVAISESALGPDHPDVASVLTNLANVEFELGDYAAAIPIHERALEIRETTLGPDHPSVALTLHNLGGCLLLLGDYDQARRHLERAVAIREKVLGPYNTNLATTLNNLAAVLRHMPGEQDEVLAISERVLAIRERELGPDHPEVGRALQILAGDLHERGADDRARPLVARALEILAKNPGATHPNYAYALRRRAVLELAAGAPDPARTSLVTAQQIITAVLGAKHPEVGETLDLLGKVELAAGDLAAARAAFNQSLALAEATGKPDHPTLAAPLQGLAEVDLRAGDDASARARATRALALLEQLREPPRRVAEARFVVARARWASGDKAEARAAATAARDALRGDVGAEKQLADVEAWLTDHARG